MSENDKGRKTDQRIAETLPPLGLRLGLVRNVLGNLSRTFLEDDLVADAGQIEQVIAKLDTLDAAKSGDDGLYLAFNYEKPEGDYAKPLEGLEEYTSLSRKARVLVYEEFGVKRTDESWVDMAKRYTDQGLGNNFELRAPTNIEGVELTSDCHDPEHIFETLHFIK